jgi:hypothetical protein
MYPNSLAILIVMTLIVLVMISFWRQLLLLIMSLFIAVFILGLHQLIYFLHL